MMFQSFRFFTPTRIEYGCGKLNTLCQEAKKFNAKRPLIVADKGIIESGLLKLVEKQLGDSFKRIDVYSDVASNPTDVSVEKGARLAIENGSDLIIAVGGGSVMDAAKVIGSFIAIFLSEWLRPLETYRMVIFGAIVIVLVLFLPQGVTGLLFPLTGKSPLVRLSRFFRSQQNNT